MEIRIFKRASSSFFLASFLFPREIRRDIFDLYSFVRVADDYVDQSPPDVSGYYALRELWINAHRNPQFSFVKSQDDSTQVRVVKNLVRVSRKHKLNRLWIESFLNSMQADLVHKPIKTNDELKEYMYGSSEVIGLMMVKILGLSPRSQNAARAQGRAFQILNFVRDIEEDNKLGRQYLPQEQLKLYGLKNLTSQAAFDHPQEFREFIYMQLENFWKWQREAEKAYPQIPYRSRAAIRTAAAMNKWTAAQIEADPLVVYSKKVKPSKLRAIWLAIDSLFKL